MCFFQKRRMEVSAAADVRAEQVRAAHQAKLLRAEQQAALVQQKKLEQTAELQKRSKLVAMKNQAIHDKRYANIPYAKGHAVWCAQRALQI